MWFLRALLLLSLLSGFAVKAAHAYEGKNYAPTKYYGIPLDSDVLLFILDVSSSMSDLEVAKEKLVESLDQLYAQDKLDAQKGSRRERKFNVIAFETSVGLLSPKMLGMSAVPKAKLALRDLTLQSFLAERVADKQGDKQKQKRKASNELRFHISRIEEGAIGRTNLFAALREVFDLYDEYVKNRKGEQSTESKVSVFLLSDGYPTVGEVQEPPGLLSYVREQNRDRKIVFHTIALSSEETPGASFLRDLAQQNSGRMVSCR